MNIIITPPIVKADSRYQQKMSWPLTFKSHLGEPHPMPMWNLDGIDWFEAHPPPRKHKHWAQM